MSFKLDSIYEVFGFDQEYSSGDKLVKMLPLGDKTGGQISPNGIIEVNSRLDQKGKDFVVKHETEHLKQIQSGKLRFDHNNFYYKPSPKSPVKVIPSSQINTLDRTLPWETANKYKNK